MKKLKKKLLKRARSRRASYQNLNESTISSLVDPVDSLEGWKVSTNYGIYDNLRVMREIALQDGLVDEEDEEEEEKNDTSLMPLTIGKSFFELGSKGGLSELRLSKANASTIESIDQENKEALGFGIGSRDFVANAPYKGYQPGTHFTLQDFRQYQKSMTHPAVMLGLDGEKVPERRPNEFTRLCEEIIGGVAELESSVDDLSAWKDSLMSEAISSNTKLELILILSKITRSKSLLQEPFFELMKKIRLFSSSWGHKYNAMTNLEDSFIKQLRMFDISIRKMEKLRILVLKFKSNRRLNMWEKLVRNLLTREQSKMAQRTVHPNMSGMSKNVRRLLSLDSDDMTSSVMEEELITNQEHIVDTIEEESQPISSANSFSKKTPLPPVASTSPFAFRKGSASSKPRNSPPKVKAGTSRQRSKSEMGLQPEVKQRESMMRSKSMENVPLSGSKTSLLSPNSEKTKKSGFGQYSFDVSVQKVLEMLGTEFDENEITILQDAIKEHFSNQPGIFGDIQSSQEILENDMKHPLLSLDPNIKRFSLQDVTELTLLHAYQMQVLYTDYEEHIDELYGRLEDADDREKALEDDFNSKLQLAQSQIDNLKAQLLKSMSDNGGFTYQKLQEVTLELERLKKKRNKRTPHFPSHPSRSYSKTPKNGTSTSASGKASAQVVPGRKRKVFNSRRLAMGFLERLEDFVRQKELIHDQLREKVRRREKWLNEERLRHINLLDEAMQLSEIEREMTELTTRYLPAVFMPMPGSIKEPKRRGPNVGKNKIRLRPLSPSPNTQKFSVLNLYELAQIKFGETRRDL